MNTVASDINDAGRIAGIYTTSASHGFLYEAGAFTTIDVPWATQTGITGTNDVGQLVGPYSMGSDLLDIGTVGYLATPTPEPASLALLATGIGVLGVGARRWRRPSA